MTDEPLSGLLCADRDADLEGPPVFVAMRGALGIAAAMPSLCNSARGIRSRLFPKPQERHFATAFRHHQ
jgi:hypothetical protein